MKSTVARKGEGVVSLPSCPARRSCLVVQVSLSSQSPALLPSRGEPAKLPVLVNRVAEPVDSWVVSDSIMSNINQDHLKVLVGRILHPSIAKAE